MSTTDRAPSFTCVTCEQPIVSRPTFHVGLAFCCAGCVADGPCICSYDIELPDDEPVMLVARPLVRTAA